MKYTILVFALFIFSANFRAQSVVDDVIIQGLWGKEKRAIIGDYIGFNVMEGQKFWPACFTYEIARKELGWERLAILDEYVQNYEACDKTATELVKRTAEKTIAVQKLLKKKFKSMSKIIVSVQVAKFIQFGNYLKGILHDGKSAISGRKRLAAEVIIPAVEREKV